MSKIDTVGIIGLGLIGGSLALALKNKRPEMAVIACGKDIEQLKQAQKDGTIDHYTKKLDETFSACDVIFVCTPVSETAIIAEKLKKYVRKETIVTDVGSTKQAVCDKMREYGEHFTFIGGHPMAGSERSGYSAARHYLFENAYYLLTPYDDTPLKKLETLAELVALTGAVPIFIPPNQHDFVTAAISHLPHVAAMALVNSVSQLGETNDEANSFIFELASGGFKDITRVASSSPAMWSGISLQNRDNILKTLETLRGKIAEYEESLKNGDEDEIFAQFEKAKAFRDKFKNARRYNERDAMRVDLEDKPGGIAFVTTVLAYRGINIKSVSIVQNRALDGGILEIILDNASDKQSASEVLRANGLTVYD